MDGTFFAALASFDIVSESHHLSGVSINFWMSRNVVSKLSIEVVEANTFDVKFFLRFIDFNVERVISLK